MNVDRINQQPARETAQSEQATVRRAGRADEQAAAQRAGRDRARGEDTLEISDRARELARARQVVDAAPDVRQEKVAAIKKRIEDGTYDVSPELLARKLLEGADGNR